MINKFTVWQKVVFCNSKETDYWVVTILKYALRQWDLEEYHIKCASGLERVVIYKKWYVEDWFMREPTEEELKTKSFY